MTDARNDPDLELPIKLEPCSNGEFLPLPISPVAAETIRRTRDEADRQARRLGLSRRTFLRSVAGAALMLTVLDRTAREAGATGGRYRLPPDAAGDLDAARFALSGEEFIFDVQVHYLNFDLAQPGGLGLGSLFPQKNCGDSDPRACFAVDHLVEEMLLKSDTDMLVMSSIPIPGDANPLSIDDMETVKRIVTELCGNGRVLTQGQTFPSIGTAAEQLEAMRQLREEHKVAAWKVYTHAGGPPWWLDDHEAGGDAVPGGVAFLENVREVGPKIVAVHKGFGLVGGDNREYADPVDVGPAAKANPDVKFIVYHSGYEPGEIEGPYTPETATQGVNRLITSARDAGIGKGGNIYAELGSTWRSVMGDPTQAAHVLGKLLAEFGADNVVWGTDSIWYGSPQDQIQAFRSFEITDEFQEEFGYPALTAKTKEKILGTTSAKIYKVKPKRENCEFTREELEQVRQALPTGMRTFGPTTVKETAALIRAHGIA